MKPTVYVALSLSHVRTDEEKDAVKRFLSWLETTFDITLLRWAFNTETWTPEPVADIYEFDTEKVLGSDLMIALYLTNEGSDGRGGEVVNRVERSDKAVVAFAKQGVRVSRYASDCLKKVGANIMSFNDFDDMKPAIKAALADVTPREVQDEFTLVAQPATS
jgi:hypothetical protein